MGVREVSGPGPAPEGPGAKKKKGVDSDSFREIMRVGKAREVDPEEKRKRKSKQESTEEAKAAMAQGAAPTAPEVKVEAPSDEFQLKIKGTAGPSLKGAAAAPYSEAPEEEEPQETPPSYSAQTPPTPPSWQQPPEVTAPTHKEKKEKKRAAPTETQPLAKKAKKLGKKPLAAPIKIAQEKKIPLEFKEETKPPLPSEKKEAFFEQLAKPKQEPKKEEVLLEGIAPPPLPQGSWEAVQEKTKKEETKKIEPTAAGLQPSLGLPPPPQEVVAPVPLTAPYLHLSTAMLDLFDRMVGVLTVMDSSGIKETTIHLTAPQYANSLFFGAEIVLTEYSTAPKAFNIELKGSPQAMALFQGNANELAAAFQGGNYSFKVNRIETSLLPTLRVRRKERVTKIKKSKE